MIRSASRWMPWNWGVEAKAKARAKELINEAIDAIKARYDAALTTDDNKRHWQFADGLSANSANNPGIRKVLRDRSRYERANNTYCKGIVNTVANHTVGKGPRLQIRTGDKAADKKLKKLWAKWFKEVGGASKLRTLCTGEVGDGESMASITTNMALRSPVKLDFKPFEPEICTNQFTVSAAMEANQVDGIDFDEYGNPKTYWLLKYHPGDTNYAGQSLDPVAHEAKNIIHLFKRERAGQERGVPRITPALPLFAQLRRYTLAVIAAAEIAALISVYLRTNGQVTADMVTSWTSFDLERNAGLVLPEGWQADQFKAEQPVTTYAEFKHEIISEISRCLDMPFNVAACNSAGHNFSSAKLDKHTYGVAIEIDQTDIETIVLDRLLAAWLDEAALIPGLIPEGLPPIAEWDHQWFWDPAPSADPLKEASAQDLKLRNGTAFLSDEWESQGFDFEAKLETEADKFNIDVEELRTIILNSIYKMDSTAGDHLANDAASNSAPPAKPAKPSDSKTKKGKSNATTGA